MRGQELDKVFRDKRTRSDVLARTKATEHQWGLVDIAIKAFISKYPTHWFAFQDMIKAQRTEYKLATKDHKELRQASFRMVACFPTIEDSEGRVIDSLLPVIKKIIPELTHKNSVNLAPFLKRYPFLNPAEKY